MEEVVRRVLTIAATGLLLSSAVAFAQTPTHSVTGPRTNRNGKCDD
jgi:hypothetical protein